MKLKIFIFAVAVMLISPFTGLSQLDQGLIAWYPLNGNANDASGNGRNGTLGNSPTFVAGPIRGTEAIHLDGQFVTIPSIELSSLSAFTISLWANVQGETSSDAGEYMIGFGQAHSDGSFTVGIDVNCFTSGNSFGFLAGNATVGSTALFLNQWHRYSMVYANGVLTAYLDGQVLGTQNGSMASTAGNAGMGIHWWTAFGGGASTRFIGSLADVRIYNRALSLSEVAELAQRDSTNPAPPAPHKPDRSNGNGNASIVRYVIFGLGVLVFAGLAVAVIRLAMPRRKDP